ncbi:MAG: dihydrofolate reductase [Ruminococcaceae bacterium]|nr:dihydrofolate reductase [Oscillospiraceae bacterium]
MSVSIIAAVGKNLELGKDNDLIWHFKEDMKFFRETTTGHTVIMGRKTFDSLPGALPNRRNIVISRNKNLLLEGAEVVPSVEKALKAADGDEIFCIGGGSIYSAFLPIADRLYLTEIDAECDSADIYFPKFDKNDYTRKKLTDFESNGVKFSHILYTRKAK